MPELENEPPIRLAPLPRKEPHFHLRNAIQCGAKTRRNTSCKQPAMSAGRCRLHGGKSTGPRTAEGKARSKMNALKHGHYTASAILAWKKIRDLRTAKATLLELRKSLAAEVQKLVSKITLEHKPATPDEILKVLQISFNMELSAQEQDRIVKEIQEPSFIEALNPPQRICTFALVTEILRESLEWMSECSLQRAEANLDSILCKISGALVEPEFPA